MAQRMRRAGLVVACVCMCVLFGAAAEAKLYKSYDDVLKSGDKAEIAAMQAALEKAGYSKNNLLLDDPPTVLVWFTIPCQPSEPYIPRRYIPKGGTGVLEVSAYPPDGTFEWSASGWQVPEPQSYRMSYPAGALGPVGVSVTYTLDEESATTSTGSIEVYAGDVDIDGIEDADPSASQDPELDPGAIIGAKGARRKITLAVTPAELACSSPPDDLHSWSLGLTPDDPDAVEFWDAETGGTKVTDPSWFGRSEGGEWIYRAIPAFLWVQGKKGAVVHLTLQTQVIDGLPFCEGAHDDTVKFTVMEAQLDADGLDNGHEENPGAFVGVGGTRLMWIGRPAPEGVAAPDDRLKLSWTPADKVRVWDNADKTGAIANGREFEVSELTEGQNHNVKAIYVEGVQASSGLMDVVLTLEYLREGAQTNDIVNFTVLQADLDIDALDEVQEDDPGGLVVRRHDGNNAPRKKIIIKKVTPNVWTGSVQLWSIDPKVSAFTAETGGDEVGLEPGSSFQNANIPAQEGLPLWVQGKTASGQMKDALLALSLNGPAGGADIVTFTVLWVEVTTKHTGQVDTDNAARDNYLSLLVPPSYDLGQHLLCTSWIPDPQYSSLAIGSEFIGSVAPANFVPSQFSANPEILHLARERKGGNGFWGPNGNENQDAFPLGDDTSNVALRDDDPQSGGSVGRVYDLDTPGPEVFPDLPANYILRFRENFEEWAVFDGIRCSAKKQWFSRQSYRKTGPSDTGTVTSGTSNSVTDASKSWASNAWVPGVIWLRRTNGQVQVRQVVSNTATTATVASVFGTTPDSDWQYVVISTSTWTPVAGVDGDNVSGDGVTPVTWDLQ